jgi:hypothetical protein
MLTTAVSDVDARPLGLGARTESRRVGGLGT